jgi:hypothetical protein
VLYQRYFLRMNQNNMASLLGLLISITLTMIVVNHMLYSTTQNSILQVNWPLLAFILCFINKLARRFFLASLSLVYNALVLAAAVLSLLLARILIKDQIYKG